MNVLWCGASVDRGQYRHVAGAVRDRRSESAPRFRAILLGHIHTDQMGLGHIRGNAWVLLFLHVLFVRLLPAISIFEVREVVHHENRGVEHAYEH